MSLEHSPARTRPQGGASKRHAPPRFDDLPDSFLSREEAAHYLGMVVSALEHDAVRQHLGIPYYSFGQLGKYRARSSTNGRPNAVEGARNENPRRRVWQASGGKAGD